MWEVRIVKIADGPVLDYDPDAPVKGDLICVGRCTVAIVPFPPGADAPKARL